MHAKKQKIIFCFFSKHNLTCEKHVILLMISNGGKRLARSEGRRWHYLAVKKRLALLRGITSKHHGDFYCMNCFNSFATENKLRLDKRVC